MAEYIVTIEGNKYKVRSDKPLSDAEAYQAAVSQLQSEKTLEPVNVSANAPTQYSAPAETARAAGQGLTFGFADELEAAFRTGKISGQEYETLRNQLRAQQSQFGQDYPKTALASEIAGGLVMPGGVFKTATKAPSILKTAGIGAGTGGVQGYGSSTSDENVASDVVTGALTGGGASGVLGTIGAAIAPKVQPQARKLQEEGISLTPGAAFGGQIQAIEQAAESLPIAGALVKSARLQSFEDFNKAAFNRSLKALGSDVQVPKDMPLREAADFTYNQISNKYSEIYPKISLKFNSTLDKQFNALNKKYSPSTLGEDYSKQFNAQINSIKDRLKNETLSGGQVKALKEDLRLMTDAYKGTKGTEKIYGDALNDLENSVMLTLRNQNPKFAADLKKADTAYANYKRVESAVASTKGESGAFTPAQLEIATKQGGTKSQYARGKSLLQDLSNPAYDVLGNKVPDSGTASRLGIMGLLTGAANYIDPSLALPTALTSGLYTKPGMSLFQKLIKPRTATTEKYGTKLRAAIPYLQSDPFLKALLEQEE